MINLRQYLKRDRGYLIYVGTPLSSPNEWTRIRELEGDVLVSEDGRRLRLKDVVSVLVAYSNGEILDYANTFQPLPEDVHFIEEYDEPVENVLDPAEMASGSNYVEVKHGTPRKDADGRWTYSTKLKNVSNERVRILQFGGYALIDGQWKLHTINQGFFSGEQFRSWYGLGKDEWILPGQTFEDPDNYGGRPVIWAYFCEMESGEKFIAGAELK